jgi:ribonucleotide reductase alpha subunit
MKMSLAYEDSEALDVNEKIFETIYYAACLASIEEAARDGSYPSYPGSPCSQSLL